MQGTDFIFTDTAVTFTAGETVKNVVIGITDDNVNESDETVVLDIVSAKNGVLVEDSVLSCTWTIVDNDESLVKFNSATASVTESDTITLKDSILVILTGQNDKTATIDYAVVLDSSTADGDSVDYCLHGSGTLTFPAFSDFAWIFLSVIGDTIAEGDESVFFACQIRPAAFHLLRQIRHATIQSGIMILSPLPLTAASRRFFLKVIL